MLNKYLPLHCLLIIGCIVTLYGCGNKSDKISMSDIDVFAKDNHTKRWYTQTQYESGKTIFQKNCAACHKQNAEGTTEWKKADANGNYPPPPLNGSAHAWHHPLSVLRTVIRDGGGSYGGLMPAWKGTLSEEEMLSTIAFFQSYWSDDIYQRWLEIEKNAQDQQ